MQKLVTFLMFEKDAEAAFKFYKSVFKGDAEMISPMMIKIHGQELYSYNGGDHFKFTDAISLLVRAKDQAEVDYLWEQLVEGGGEHSQCGWLKDRYGVSWQIVPERFFELVSDPDRANVGRVVSAMMKMTKMDIVGLEAAAKGD